MIRQVITRDDAVRARAGDRSVTVTPSRAQTGAGESHERVAAAREIEPDKYVDRLLKYIPTEVVALYIFLDGAIQGAPPNVPRGIVLWTVFVLLLAGTWVYLQRVQNVTNRVQLTLSTGAFLVWVFYLGGPFTHLPGYERFYGSLVLPLYTFGIALVEPKSDRPVV